MDKEGNKSQEQFLRLLMLNDKSIYMYILSLVSNSSDADDIMQETSAVMWRKFSGFRHDMDFVSWAFTIARYQVLCYFKKRKRSKIIFSDALMSSIEEDVERKIPEIDDRLKVLKGCIKKLSHGDQTLLKLRYDKGYTFENIGAHISKSTRATFYCLSRVHEFLLRCVKRTLNETRGGL